MLSKVYLVEMASVLDVEDDTYVRAIPYGIYANYPTALAAATTTARINDDKGRNWPDQTMYIEYAIYECDINSTLKLRYATPEFAEYAATTKEIEQLGKEQPRNRTLPTI